ncbi:hypothetical protein [Streptomyces sp. NPDC006997]|uniref:hypothetical protein n=1 Tax=Streptomyces sp. NPDC006997 TaxID=3155356 RepID=UPI0033FF327A
MATSTPTRKGLAVHRNAPLTETGRLRLARRVVDGAVQADDYDGASVSEVRYRRAL